MLMIFNFKLYKITEFESNKNIAYNKIIFYFFGTVE